MTAASALAAQVEVELRAATPEYWYGDLSITIGDRLLLDGVVVGWPGYREGHAGLGVLIEPAPSVTVIPLAYAVFGTGGSSGLTFGGYLYADPGGWRMQGFAGRFIATDGSAVDYTYIDAFDLTRAVGTWEIGATLDFYRDAAEVAWRLGPAIKRNDRLGTWGVSLRLGWGGTPEVRLTRALARRD